MRHWYLVIVLSFIAFVIAGKPSISTDISQPLVAQAATEVGRSLPSKTTVVSKPTLETRMFDFFNTHPDPGVRDDLHRLLRNKQVRVSWNVVGAAVAAFGVTPDELGELVPVLVMDPELFHVRNRSIAQITVYHEYLHYLQWRDGTVPKETFLIRDSLLLHEIHDWCKEKWHAEVLAYHEACAFGRTNGLVQNLRLGGPCRSFAPLKEVCSIRLSSAYSRVRIRRDLCVPRRGTRSDLRKTGYSGLFVFMAH